MNGTDRASHYLYHHYRQARHYHHQYQQHHHPLHEPLPSLAGSFPFGFDVDSLPTGGRHVDHVTDAGSRVFAAPPTSSAPTTTPECCYDFDAAAGMRRYPTNEVVPPGAPASVAAAYVGFRSSSTCRSNVDARFLAASTEIASQTASPADLAGGSLLADVKVARPTPASDAPENGLPSNCAASVCTTSNPVTSSGRSDDVYTLHSDSAQRHHRRPSSDDKNDDVIKNVKTTDVVVASPSRDQHSVHADRKTREGAELKRDVHVSKQIQTGA